MAKGSERFIMPVGAGQSSPDQATSAPAAATGAPAQRTDSPEFQHAMNVVKAPKRWDFLAKFRSRSDIPKLPDQQGKPQEVKKVPTVDQQLTQQEKEALVREVMVNAQLNDEERIKKAGEVLGAPLSPVQETALLAMHQAGGSAGVFNYDQAGLREKVAAGEEVGKDVFTAEQRRVLMEAGLAGVVPSSEIVIDPNIFPANSPLRAIAEEIQDVAVSNEADEVFFKDTINRIHRVVESGAVAYSAAKDLLRSVKQWLNAAEQTPAARGNSVFEQVEAAYGWYESKEKRQVLTPQEETEKAARKAELDNLIDEAINNGALAYALAELRSLYMEVASPPKATSSYYEQRQQLSVSERIKYIREVAGNYKETFWEIYKIPKDLQRKYEGIGRYFASQVGLAIEKVLKGIPLSATEKGDQFVREMEQDRLAERRKERERATGDERLKYNEWARRFEFTWAENLEELEDSVFDWLEKFEHAMPHENPDLVNNFIQEWRQNGINALEVAFNRLHISAKSPEAMRLKSTIEAYVNVLGGVRLLENKGGFDPYTVCLEIFSYNFNEHHDAIYLGNAKSAIIQDFLSQNDGEICLGGPDTIEKPLDGDTRTFRTNLELEAKAYAASLELYIRKGDFEEAEGTAAERARGENNRYGWEDKIEELLLKDSRGVAKANLIQEQALKDEAIARVNARTRVFQKIKDRLDSEDMYTDSQGREVSLADCATEDQRKDVIRKRIRNEMDARGHKILGRNIDAMTDQIAKDKALWRWVKYNNSLREKNGVEAWFPSKWDAVRLNIDRPTKLVDRSLLVYKENGKVVDELKAMFEKVEDAYQGLTDDQISIQIAQEFEPEIFEARVRTEILAKIQQGLSRQEADQEYALRLRGRERERNEKIEQVLFHQEQRRVEAERAYNINRAYQKFLGVDARWGGLTTRIVAENGQTKLKTIFSEARDILKAKIDKEADEIEKEVAVFEATLASRNLTAKQKEKAITKKRRLLRRDATFAVALGLREIGIGFDIPGSEYFYYSDPARIQAFALLVGYTHNDKGVLPQLLDRQRREMEAVFSFLADKYMDKNGGEVLVVTDDPDVGQHEERQERSRVINEGGEFALRDLFESRFMISTSGGVEAVDLITKIADLGIYDLLWEHGCQNFREFQGFLKRRDEVELRQQSFWNTRKWADPISYAQRLRGASMARIFLVGGEVKGQGLVPGLLNEPMSGAYKYRDMFYKRDTWLEGGTVKGKLDMGDPKLKEKIKEELGKLENIKAIDPKEMDKLVEIGAGIMKPLIDYMNARRYVMNRAGLAPKNWKYDNELIVNAYLKHMFNEDVMGSKNLDYAQPGRSPIAVYIFRNILKTSTYHILVQKDVDVLYPDAEKTKIAMQNTKDTIAKRLLPVEVQNTINNRVQVLRAQGMGQRIDSLIHRLQTLLNMNPAIIDSLINISEETKKKLIEKGVNKDILEDEIRSFSHMQQEKQKIKELYVETTLHKEFTREWPARLAA